MASEFGFKRLGKIDMEGDNHFNYLHISNYIAYEKDVINGEIYCFAIYKDKKRVGTTLAEMRFIEGEKTLICLETGGIKNGYSFENEYYKFYMGIAKIEECKKFRIGTARKAVERKAEKLGLNRVYSEWEINVK